MLHGISDKKLNYKENRYVSSGAISTDGISVINSALSQALQYMDEREEDDPHQYYKVLVWATNEYRRLWNEKLARDKADGWKIEKRIPSGYVEFPY
jgi:hypothetical protein